MIVEKGQQLAAIKQQQQQQQQLEDEEDGDNDEENIVIDMADEDDDDDEEDENCRRLARETAEQQEFELNFRHQPPQNNGQSHFVSAYTGNNNNNDSPHANQKVLIEAEKSLRLIKGQQQQTNGQANANASHNNNNNNSNNNDHCQQQQQKQQQRFNIGDLVWFDPNQLGFSIPGKVIDFYPDLNMLTVEGYAQPAASELGDANKLQLLAAGADQELKVYDLSDAQQFKSVKLRLPLSDERGVSDLVELDEVSPESIIWNLKLRHKNEIVYTRCGHRILLSINPFKQLCNVYNLDQVNRYDTINASKLSVLNRCYLSNSNHCDTTNSQVEHELTHPRYSGSSNSLLRWLLLQDGNHPSGASGVKQRTQVAGRENNEVESGGAQLSRLQPIASSDNLEPHIFGLANEALKRLLISGQDQSFVLLGESGSGKTETCKLLVQYLATVNKSPTNLMTEQILESIQVLESFGNAKTVHNDNSSRFGKLLDIRFNLANGFIIDAKTIDLNLLDRTRIVSQAEDERNYHIFYELLAGLSGNEKEKYGLQTAEKYFYLNQGHCVELSAKEDGDDFRSLLASMQVLGFNYEEQDTIFRLLASVLHLGNIYFHRKVLAVRSGKLAQQQQKLFVAGNEPGQGSGGVSAPLGGVEGVEIGSDTEVRWVSHLLQIQFDAVMRCLTVRTTDATTTSLAPVASAGPYACMDQQQQATQVIVDRIVTPLNIDQALDTRDAIARTLYTCLFKWLVQRINAMINGCQTHAQSSGATGVSHHQAASGARRVKNMAGAVHNHSGIPLPGNGASVPSQPPGEPIYLCRTSESLCEFQPDKLNEISSRASTVSRSSNHTRQANFDSSMSRTSQRNNTGRNNYINEAELLRARLSSATISILDAFGFENLSENNFEQLCINYTAELLQYHTSRYLLRLEQAEYAKERLRWTPITVPNTSSSACGAQLAAAAGPATTTSLSQQPATSGGAAMGACSTAAIINLISKKPLGILALLDDECNFPKATDQSFVEKCHHNHTLNENYQRARLASNCQEFGVRHFKQSSRLVWYQVDGFIEKNRDSLRPDILELLLGSKMAIVGDMLRKLHQTQADYMLGGSKTLSRTYDGRYVCMKPRATTVAARFLDTLHNNRVLESINYSTTSSTGSPAATAAAATTGLPPGGGGGTGAGVQLPAEQSHYQSRSDCHQMALGALPRPNPWFVVCLKPNRWRTAQAFDVAYVQEQVRCLNLVEMVEIRKTGYPIRMRYGEFVRRYKCLVPVKFLNNLASCQDIQAANQRFMQQQSGCKSVPQTGYGGGVENKRAIRDLCGALIEYRFKESVEQLNLVRDQYQCGLTKMFLNERLFYQVEQMRLIEHQRAVSILQKSLRMWLLRRHYQAQRRAAILIQAQVRGHLARRHVWRQYELVLLIQRRWRRQLAIKRRKALEAKRKAQRARQQHQMFEIQMQQRKQSNQLRFRLQPQSGGPVGGFKGKPPGGAQAGGIYGATRTALDIPEDLAQLYRLQRDWLPVHDLSHVNEIGLSELVNRERRRQVKHANNSLSVPFVALDDDEYDEFHLEQNGFQSNSNRIDLMSERQRMIELEQVLHELESDERYSLHNFLAKYYTLEAPQFGYSRYSITRPFSWQRMARARRQALKSANKSNPRNDAQDASYLKAHTTEAQVHRYFNVVELKAVSIYKLILRYIDSDLSARSDQQQQPSSGAGEQPVSLDNSEQRAGDVQKVIKFKLIADYLIYLCLSEPLLRDEIYLQLVSQSWQNPKAKSSENVWKLMLNCLSCFGPVDRELLRFMLKYANDYCCDKYHALALERLGEHALTAASGGEARNSNSDLNVRKYPPTMLEYFATQEAKARLALSASCYMDDHALTGPPVQEPVGHDEGEVCDNSHSSSLVEDVSTTNHASRTLVQVSSRTRAETLAAAVLRARHVPEGNFIGWSVEVQHEGALSEFSSRLRGDDYLLDHLSRVELLPEFVQLVDSGGAEFLWPPRPPQAAGGESQFHEPAYGASRQVPEDTLQQQSLSYGGQQRARKFSLGESSHLAGGNDRWPANHHLLSPTTMGNPRNSVISQRSSDIGGSRRHSYLSPDLYGAGRLSQTSKLNRRYLREGSETPCSDLRCQQQPGAHHQFHHPHQRLPQNQQQQHYAISPNDPNLVADLAPEAMRLHRRSMSMQELQLASSALNGRYFNAGPQQQAVNFSHQSGVQFPPGPVAPSSHYASSYVSPAASAGGGGRQRNAGSLQQLTSPSSQLHQQQYQHQAAYAQGRRRSQTPNSLLGPPSHRISSSAYGSESHNSAAYLASPTDQLIHSAATGGRSDERLSRAEQQQQLMQAGGSMALDGQRAYGPRGAGGHRPRRSASSSSRAPSSRSLLRPMEAGSDYASAHSDYERVGARHNQQRARPPPTGAQVSSGRRPAGASGPQHPGQDPRYQQAALKQTRPLRPSDYDYGHSPQQFPPMASAQQQQQTAYLGSHYMGSSAMSDTSEAPSLASHVRGVKVPQHNGDLDQYLDDLFNPMLDEAELDELSDARSLATSIRGTRSIGRLVDCLTDPEHLASMIRGTTTQADSPASTSQAGENPVVPPGGEHAAPPLSPTFESLLTSLKSGAEILQERDQAMEPTETGDEPLMSRLGAMNLTELKALNEQLEHQIQAAQLNRPSLDGATGAQIPAPPPQPSFGSSAIEDIYSRAKTVRIGKWRWPPARDQLLGGEPGEQGDPQQVSSNVVDPETQIINYFESKERKRLSQLSASSRTAAPDQVDTSLSRNERSSKQEQHQSAGLNVPPTATAADQECSAQASSSASAAAGPRAPPGEQEASKLMPPPQIPLLPGQSTFTGSVGKLKISSEMKAKLEQLTTTSTGGRESGGCVTPTQTTASGQGGIVSQAKSLFAAAADEGRQSVKRLADQRRNLLAEQLMGRGSGSSGEQQQQPEASSPSNRNSVESVSGKVLAAKQQLAAAAGVALAALDSGGQARLSSASCAGSSGTPAAREASEQRRSRVLSDELGPQSQAAISQRQAFYRMSASSDQLDLLESSAAQSPGNQLASSSSSVAVSSASARPQGAQPAVNEEQQQRHAGSELHLRQTGSHHIPPPNAISSDNLSQVATCLSGGAQATLTRATPMAGNLNEAGREASESTSPATARKQDSERLYGHSIAKSLAQRHQESLQAASSKQRAAAAAGSQMGASRSGRSLASNQSQAAEPWVASSPDRTLEGAAGRRRIVKRATSNDFGEAPNSKRRGAPLNLNASSAKQQQQKKEQQQLRRQERNSRSDSSTSGSRRPELMEKMSASHQDGTCLVYANVDWQIKIRKEFFLPSETYDHPLVVQLIFAQLVADVFNPRHWTRLNNKERAAIKSLMKDNSIGYAPSLPQIGQMEGVKRELVRMARSFGLYFTRSYPANNFALMLSNEELEVGGAELKGNKFKQARVRRHSASPPSSSNVSDEDVDEADELNNQQEAIKLTRRLRANNNLGAEWIDMVAVHHSGLRLVAVVSGEPAATLQSRGPATVPPTPGPPFGYKVIETLKYRDMTDVSQVGANELLVSMRNGKKCWIVSSDQATQLGSLLKRFHADYNEHLKSSSSGKSGNKQAFIAGESGSLQRSQQQKGALTSKDALLAPDDDHHGDHIKKRQITDGLGRLRKATHSNDDLADSERVLSNHLAHPSKTSERSQQQRANDHHNTSYHPGKLAAKSSSATCSSISDLAPNADGATANSSANQRGQRRPSGVPLSNQEQESTTKSSKKKTTTTNSNKTKEEELFDESGNQISKEKTPLEAGGSSSGGSSKSGRKNLWQNSLSRMSNKFSIFSGSQSRASSNNNNSNKQQYYDQPPMAKSSQAKADGQQVAESPRSPQVVLDAWIEAKEDFDEDDESSLNGSNGPAISEQHKQIAEHQQQQQAETEGGDEQQRAPGEPESLGSVKSKRSQHGGQQQQQQSSSEQSSADAEADGKHSLLQFALYNFREAIDKYSLESRASKAPGDTSTLRGSLKLIETLRSARSSNESHPSAGGQGGGSSGKERKSAGSRLLPTSSGGSDWTWRELAEMVKFTQAPIRNSLLKLPSEDLNKRAVDCFSAIMQYMGDMPPPPVAGQNSKQQQHYQQQGDEVECVYLILMNCHNFPILRDEIYCQLMKQTTNNRSSQPDSCLRGWRLFSIVAAYFDCSETFKPYLLKYLETAAYDKRRAYCSVASLCLQNLRKTFKYNGRKNVPSIEEIAATSAGRNSKRQIYRLPGGTERVINTKSTTVVEDIIHEICSNMLNVTDPDEMLEFSLYCIADGDLYTMPLNRDEYILDITTELIKNHQQYFLIFCRSIWHYPLRLDSKLYIEVIFNQIAPDYLEGLLLVLPSLRSGSGGPSRSSVKHGDAGSLPHHASRLHQPLRLKSKLVKEISRIAALLHRASGTDYMPHKDEIKYLLPKPIISAMKQYQRAISSGQAAGVDHTLGGGSNSLASSDRVSSGHTGDGDASSASDYATSSGASATTNQASQETVITTPSKWIELVQNNWREMSAFDTLDAKAQFLDIVRHWPLFGSSFFAIKFIQRDLIQPMDFILALNKNGIQMLDMSTHETMHKYPFNEVISTRKVRSEDGALFLDLKCGNLMKRTIIRIQTDQAHEISRLIRQYIDIELLQQKQHQQLAVAPPMTVRE